MIFSFENIKCVFESDPKRLGFDAIIAPLAIARIGHNFHYNLEFSGSLLPFTTAIKWQVLCLNCSCGAVAALMP